MYMYMHTVHVHVCMYKQCRVTFNKAYYMYSVNSSLFSISLWPLANLLSLILNCIKTLHQNSASVETTIKSTPMHLLP